jgi:hypothetical protein
MCKTSRSVIDEYIMLMDLRLSGKKQKENERKMAAMRESHYNLVNDATLVTSMRELEKECDKEERHLEYLKTYIDNQIKGISEILVREKYVIGNDKWLIASNIHEIHPLVITDFITSDSLPISPVGLLSLWSDIKIKEANATSHPLKEKIEQLYDKYRELETEYGIDYGGQLMNITEEYLGDMFEMWATQCDTVEECKYFIQEQLSQREISLGDFTKGCLKMVAIAKELEVALVSIEKYVELASKFGQVERQLCKFIVSPQSLYV